MDKFKPKLNVHKGPEAKIQAAIVKYLEERDWIVDETHGNAFQKGFPDVHATHRMWRQRWIEVKNPVSFSFTPAQLKRYPLWHANGTPIWVLTGVHEYDLLFKPANLYEFLAAYYDGQTNINKRRGG
jgi:hypothetical protein